MGREGKMWGCEEVWGNVWESVWVNVEGVGKCVGVWGKIKFIFACMRERFVCMKIWLCVHEKARAKLLQ